MEAKKKKAYQKPTLTTFGTIANLTKFDPGGTISDIKGGSDVECEITPHKNCD